MYLQVEFLQIFYKHSLLQSFGQFDGQKSQIYYPILGVFLNKFWFLGPQGVPFKKNSSFHGQQSEQKQSVLKP